MNEFATRLSFNIISRIIGLIIRLNTIVLFLISELLVIIGFPPLIILWLIPFPLTPLYYLTRPQPQTAPTITPGTKVLAREFLTRIVTTAFGKFMCNRLNLDPHTLIEVIEPSLTLRVPKDYSPLLIPESRKLQDYLFNHGITRDDLSAVKDWFDRLEKERKVGSQFWELDNLLRIPSIGKTWAYGFTPNLDRFVTDLLGQNVNEAQFIGRSIELRTLEETLSRAHGANVLLVGEPGIGRHTILRHLAHLSYEGRTLPTIEGKRFLRLDMERVFDNTTDLSGRKAALSTLCNEAQRAGNIVLIIDDFDRFVSSRQDRMDMSDVLSHVIESKNIHIVGILTPGNFSQFVQPQQSLMEQFDVITIHEPGRDEMMKILESLSLMFEKKGVVFTFPALQSIITLSDRYIKETPFPQKAIDVMDKATSHFGSTDSPHIITPLEIESIIGEIAKTPITITGNEKELLLNLENHIHTRIINQKPAVTALAQALRRGRANVGTRKEKPFGVFLFLGPTGVGKTETAKALAQHFFGAENRMIRFDMSEFQESDSLVRFLGDFKTNTQGVFATQLRQNPFAVLLLDEFEKANRSLLNLFLSGFDEGSMTDAFGKKIYLTNTIIIATTNAGSEFIREFLKKNMSEPKAGTNLKTDLLEHVQREHIFSPELLNRFDDTIVFTPLNQQNTLDILTLRITSITQKLLDERGITLTVSPQTKEKILTEGFSVDFGGRALNRALQTYLENPLSESILREEIKRGETISI